MEDPTKSFGAESGFNFAHLEAMNDSEFLKWCGNFRVFMQSEFLAIERAIAELPNKSELVDKDDFIGALEQYEQVSKRMKDLVTLSNEVGVYVLERTARIIDGKTEV